LSPDILKYSISKKTPTLFRTDLDQPHKHHPAKIPDSLSPRLPVFSLPSTIVPNPKKSSNEITHLAIEVLGAGLWYII